MSTRISPLAGKPATAAPLTDIRKLLEAYTALEPDVSEPTQRVAFGTSGHRGTSLERSFNEWHVLAITQAICDYRAQQRIDGPLFIGIDTHALVGAGVRQRARGAGRQRRRDDASPPAANTRRRRPSRTPS